MTSALSLAQLIDRNATTAPDAAALIAGEIRWTWQSLLDDARQLAAQIPAATTPYACQGSSLDLARHAYACSIRQRPFWPLDQPLNQLPPAPEAAALIISTSGSEGQAKAVALSNTNLASAATDTLPPGRVGLIPAMFRASHT